MIKNRGEIQDNTIINVLNEKKIGGANAKPYGYVNYFGLDPELGRPPSNTYTDLDQKLRVSDSKKDDKLDNASIDRFIENNKKEANHLTRPFHKKKGFHIKTKSINQLPQSPNIGTRDPPLPMQKGQMPQYAYVSQSNSPMKGRIVKSKLENRCLHDNDQSTGIFFVILKIKVC